MENTEIMLKIQELENRIEALENKRGAKGVVTAGAPKYVQAYLKIKHEEKINGK